MDLIDRQEAIKAIYTCLIDGEKEVAKYRAGKTFDHFTHALSDAIDAVEDLPSAEKRGKWVSSNPNAPMFGFHYCSICGRKRTSPQDNFCPNCGAAMESEE